MHRKTFVASFMASFLLASVSAFGASSDNAKAKGMIISRTGETLIVKTKHGKITVVLDDDTKTRDKKGLFGLQEKKMSNAVLIPGLKVDVDGVPGAHFGQIVAKTITVDGDDLETAEMIQAGLHPTAEEVVTNQQNIATNKQSIETNQQNIATNKQQIQENIKDIEENTNRFTALSEYEVKGD